VTGLRRQPPAAPTELLEAHSAAHDAAVQAHSWSNLSQRRTWLVLASVMMGMLLAAIDQTVVGTAMPRIIADLNGMAHYAWVATAYLLASTASMPIWGKLSDAYGRKLFFIVGMALFMAGSALCGQAHSMTELILFRGFQGLGGGAMMPITQAIIGDLFPPAERGKWVGVLMSVFGLATIVGPTAGGWITDNLGWRWVFYVNLPVGIPALFLAAAVLPAHVRLHKHRIDYTGAGILIAASVPLLLGFSWGGTTYAWGSGIVIAMFAFSVIAWVAFVLYESRAAEPILSPSLFSNSIFAVSSVAGFVAMAGMFGAVMFLPLFVQGVLGDTATNSGVVLTPLMLGFIASSIIGGQILSRTGKYRWLLIGSFVVTICGLYLLSTMGVATSHGTLIGFMVVTGLGMGIGMAAFTIVVQNAFPLSRLGEVTAGLQFFRSIGGTIGLAIFGTVLNNQFASAMHARMPTMLQAAAAKNPALLSNPQVLVSPQAKAQLAAAFDRFGPQGHSLFSQFMAAVRDSMDVAIGDLFLIAAVVTGVGLAVLFFLKEIPLRTSHAMPENEEGEDIGEEEDELGIAQIGAARATAKGARAAEGQAEP
jgi:EmrB/QacA subfamily drug resistance transporter